MTRAYGLEVHGGPALPIATTVLVSGGANDTGVSSTVTTTFEIDGCVVEYDGVVPFRPGDDVVVAGKRDRRGVLEAYAVRLPRQGVTLGHPPDGYWLGGVAVILVGLVVLLFVLPNIVVDIGSGDWPMPGLLQVGMVAGCGILFVVGGMGFIRWGVRADRARVLVWRARRPPVGLGQGAKP